MTFLLRVETKLDEIFGKKAPIQLPAKARQTIVEYLPWINLVLGIVTLLAARVLWQWAHPATSLINYVNTLSQSYGGAIIATHRLSLAVWLGLIVLIVEGLLFISAFPGTRDRRKNGWDLLFYAALVNVVYGVVILFSDYGGLGRLLTTLLTSALELYFLFQIRDYYTGRKASLPSATTPKS